MTDDDFKNTEYYQEYMEWSKESDANLEEQKKTGYIVGFALNTYQKGGTYNYDKLNKRMPRGSLKIRLCVVERG